MLRNRSQIDVDSPLAWGAAVSFCLMQWAYAIVGFWTVHGPWLSRLWRAL
jgi:hypothetical protein